MNFNQTRTAANVNARSLTLFATGYTAVVTNIQAWGKDVRITSPAGTVYLISELLETCTCPFFEKNNRNDDPFASPVNPCKHYLGYEKLLHDMEAARLKADADACEMNTDTYRNAIEAVGAVYF